MLFNYKQINIVKWTTQVDLLGENFICCELWWKQINPVKINY